MKRFFKNLFHDLVSGPARGGKPTSRRTLLQAEGLEDRVVLSGASAGMSGSTLVIDVAQSTTVELYESVSGANRQIEVIGATGNPQFSINSISGTQINVSGNDTILINDSDGMPFASNTTITFQGVGTGNTVNFFGSRAVDTDGAYIVDGLSPTETIFAMDHLAFEFNPAYSTVTDSIQLTGGPLFVGTSGQNVFMDTPYGGAQALSGMGAAAGNLVYSNMSTVELSESGADASVTLEPSAAAVLENQFSVSTYGLGDTVDIVSTPSSVSTAVHLNGSDSEAVLEGNSGFVSVSGIQSSSTMIVGHYTATGDSTHGIQAKVQVSGMNALLVADNANTSTKENVTVTQSTISGTGLFGNNSAEIVYSGVNSVDLFSGQLQDSYTVKASSSTASFSSAINIVDDSTQGFSAHVDLDANTHLKLSLNNETSKAGELFIDAPGAKFENSNGVVDVFFNGVLSSQIDFNGFKIEEEHS